jgi:predicted transcriptional regulator YheO
MSDDTDQATAPAELVPKAALDSADQLIPLLLPVIRALAAAVGPHCELVLHDLTRPPDQTIVAIENGHVTGREVGGPSTNLGLEMLRSGTTGSDEYGYRTRTRDGRELRSSSVYFRDRRGRLIGSLCVNLDLTPYQMAQRAVEQLMPPAETITAERDETFASDINTVLTNLLDTAIARTGKSVAMMDRADKIEVLRFLDERGAFFVKRAMDRIARRLGLSRVTAYAYLDQARSTAAE